MMPPLYLIKLKNTSILDQLKLEEALLRSSQENLCLINEGSPPAIVMGISGKMNEHIDQKRWELKPIPIIKRFSGGGTVFVDHNTLFVSFIMQKALHSFPCFPEPILRWSASFYQKALSIQGLKLQENDYVIGNLKCGGNAQYIQKTRFVHHTTFLWDYLPESMSYLLHPPKTPKYRKGRSHQDFLCTLKDYLPSKRSFIDSIESSLKKSYQVFDLNINDAWKKCSDSHRKTTTSLSF